MNATRINTVRMVANPKLPLGAIAALAGPVLGGLLGGSSGGGSSFSGVGSGIGGVAPPGIQQQAANMKTAIYVVGGISLIGVLIALFKR